MGSIPGRLAAAIVARYPRAWRERYADEMLSLVDDRGVAVREVVGMPDRPILLGMQVLVPLVFLGRSMVAPVHSFSAPLHRPKLLVFPWLDGLAAGTQP